VRGTNHQRGAYAATRVCYVALRLQVFYLIRTCFLHIRIFFETGYATGFSNETYYGPLLMLLAPKWACGSNGSPGKEERPRKNAHSVQRDVRFSPLRKEIISIQVTCHEAIHRATVSFSDSTYPVEEPRRHSKWHVGGSEGAALWNISESLD
jgi:hypothetical protein